VLDGIRAVDYLCSRPDVDRTRIGFTGESGGGNSTYWVSALDDRITLSVPVSSAGAFEQWIKVDTNYDWHQRPPGIRAFADIGTLYAMVAPKPLLVINGHPELAEFALPDALRSVAYAKAVYHLYGRAERVAFVESSTGHGYQPDKRTQLYRWLNRWFFAGKMPYGEEELPYTPEPRETLRAGMPEDSLSIPALARRWVDESIREYPLPAGAKEAREFQVQKRRELESLLGRKPPGPVPQPIFRAGDALASGGYQAERLQFEVEPDLIIPALLVRKPSRAKYKTVIVLEKRRGASAEAQALLEAGYALLLLDVRGTGEMDWGGGRTSNWADLLGRPPIGMWAEDVSQAVSYLLSRNDVDSVGLLAYGLFGKVALYAAALDSRIAAAAVSTDSLSYRQEATSGLVHVYADVPHILTWGDTAQLAALVAPRPLAILSAGLPDTRDEKRRGYFSPLPRFAPSEARVSPDDLAANYAWTKRFYAALDAGPRFETGTRNVAQWFSQNY
jgi:cephalosporin-C deacetylase-like acetyl esterase